MADQPVTAPAGDAETARCVVVETRRTVAGLTAAIQRGCTRAASSRRELVLLSMVDTRVTYPLLQLLREPTARWVVHEGRGGRHYDGLTGVPLAWDGETFAETGERPPLVAPRPGSAGVLEVDVEARHRPTSELLLGRLVDEVAAVAGGEPGGWGTGEPVTQRWSARELTRFCRERMPQASSLAVVGASLTGMLAVQRDRAGVREHLRAAVGASAEPGPDALRDVAARLVRAGARSAVLSWQSGSEDGSRTPRPHPPLLPLGALLPAGRADAGIPGEPLPDAGGAVWIAFGAFPYRDLARVTAVLGS